jgi:hypothetical protein
MLEGIFYGKRQIGVARRRGALDIDLAADRDEC